MFFDIIVAAILVITMVLGFRRGFIYSFVNTLGWVGSFICGFIGCRILADQLTLRTNLETTIYDKFLDNISGSLESITSSAESLPLIMNETIDTAAATAAEALAERLTEISMLVISFLIIFFVIKLIAFLITTAFSKRNNDGFVGFVDGILGLVAGGIKGILIVFLFLMLLVPCMNLMAPESTEIVLESLDNSYLAGQLYDANFLALILS